MAVYKRFNGKRVKYGQKGYDKGTWVFEKRIKGKLIKRALPEATSKEHAEQIAEQILKQIANGRYGLTVNRTFRSFAENEYTRYVKQANVNVKVKLQFISTLVEFFGDTLLSAITPQDCRDFQFKRLHTPTIHKKRRSAGSVNKETSTLSKLFTLAVEQKLIDASPMERVKKLEEPDPRKRDLTPEQIERLFIELQPYSFLRRLVILGLNLPLRQGQYMAIRPEHIDFVNNRLWTTASKRKPARIVPLNSIAVRVLREMIAEGQIPSATKWFPQKRWREVLIKAGINKVGGTREENFHFHDLRCVFGSHLQRQGVSPFVIKELFNHSDMETSAIYVSVNEPQKRAALAGLEVQNLGGID